MRRRTLLLLLLALLLFAGRPAMAQAPGFVPADEAVALLRGGGLSLYMRHATTDRSQVDTGRLGDRAGQRNLSPAGEVLARDLGASFQRLGLPVAEVLTSPVFRAQDTARLAFGAAVPHPALVADDYASRDPGLDAAEVSALLGRPVAGGNRVMVGHIVPLGMILGRPLSQAAFPEGALALFRPDGTSWRLLGIVPAETLIGAER